MARLSVSILDGPIDVNNICHTSILLDRLLTNVRTDIGRVSADIDPQRLTSDTRDTGRFVKD